MRWWTVMRFEWRRIWGNRLMRAALLAGVVLPVLYSGLFLWAFWDPYGKLDRLPVALVNEDTGGTLDGQSVRYGRDVAEKLVKDRSLEWHVVSAAEAQRGLADGRYYMTVYIPSHFTSDILSVNSDRPRRAEIDFIPNQGRNYLTGQIFKRVQDDIAASLDAEFSQTFISRLLDVVGQEAGGIGRAAQAARSLADGADRVRAGSAQAAAGVARADAAAHQLAAAMTRLTPAAGQVANGIAQTEAGTSAVTRGLQQALGGIQQMRDRLAPLAGNAAPLAQGASQAAAAASQLQRAGQSVMDGLTQTQSGAETLATGTGQAATSAAQLAVGMSSVLQTLRQSGAAQDPQVAAAIEQLSQLTGGAQNLASALSQLQAGAGRLAAGAHDAAAGQVQLVAGLGRLSGQLGQAAGGLQQFASGVGQLDQGLARVEGGLTQGVSALNHLGAAQKQLADGAGRLAAGLRETQSGAASLASGLDAAATGTRAVADGAAQVANGATTFAGKLAGAQLGKVTNPDAKAQVMARPVDSVMHPANPVSTYGAGLAPYFLSLSLWVGALMLYFLVSFREGRWRVLPVPSAVVTMGKLGVLALIAAVQAVVAATVLRYGLGLPVQTAPGFYGFTVLLAVVDVTVIGALLSLLGTGPGRFVAIVLLLLQLTSSGGTFPMELVPRFFQTIHAWLPMTYAVDAFRRIIAYADPSAAWHDAGIVALFGIGAAVILILSNLRPVRAQELQAPDTLIA